MPERRQTTSNGPSGAQTGRSASRAERRSIAPGGALLEDAGPSAAETPVAQEMVATWVRNNPMLALLGGIALGVFIGTMMRS
jgi:hypothetical protein